MDVLISPLPLFNRDMEVLSYYLDYQKGNKIIEMSLSALRYDRCFESPMLKLISEMTLEALTYNKSVFIEITDILLNLDLEQQCTEDPKKIIFVLSDIEVSENSLAKIQRLKQLGFRFAINEVINYNHYEPLLKIMDYFIFKSPADNIPIRSKILWDRFELQTVVLNVSSHKEYTMLADAGVNLLSGNFYRVPISKNIKEIAPLRMNYLNLIQMANKDDFEIEEFTKYVSQDTALALEFLRMVNSTKFGVKNEIKTIKHAASMLGEKEIRKWITTAVANILSKDKPSEITRLSLIRARFAENLALQYNIEHKKDELFLLGLFSILDVVLDVKIEKALDIIGASQNMKDALANSKGPYYPIYKFIKEYELGDWQSISLELIQKDISVDKIYELYHDVIIWYNNLIKWEPEAL